MALIKCKECGKEISDQAVACPNCGYSMAQTNTLIQIDSAPQKRKKYRVRFLIFTPIFFIGLILSMIWGFSKMSGGESGQLGFWLLVAFIGFVGMIASAIGSWLSRP